MAFARDETRQRLAGSSGIRRQVSALVVAIAAHAIVSSMWNPRVYAAAGLDPERARREARRNRHHQAMLRSSCAGLMEFLDSVGLLTAPARRVYRAAHLL